MCRGIINNTSETMVSSGSRDAILAANEVWEPPSLTTFGYIYITTCSFLPEVEISRINYGLIISVKYVMKHVYIILPK